MFTVNKRKITLTFKILPNADKVMDEKRIQFLKCVQSVIPFSNLRRAAKGWTSQDKLTFMITWRLTFIIVDYTAFQISVGIDSDEIAIWYDHLIKFYERWGGLSTYCSLTQYSNLQSCKSILNLRVDIYGTEVCCDRFRLHATFARWGHQKLMFMRNNERYQKSLQLA